MKTSEWKKNNPFLYRLLKEQYRCAKAEMPEELVGDWYSKTTWTTAQATRYRNWFIITLMHNKVKTKNAFSGFYGRRKDAEKIFSMWFLSYGFREVG